MKRNTLLFYISLLLLAVTVAYSNHFYNGFHFDDTHSVWNNPNIRNIKNIPRFFKDGTTSSVLPQNQAYRPVTTSSLAIDYWLGNGYDLFYFHLSTFILFLLQGVLMVFFFNKIFSRSSVNHYVMYVALFGVAWYMLHPAVAETVNYVIARADIQSTVAVLAGFMLYAGSPFCRKTFIYLLPVAIGVLAKPPAVMFAPLLFFYILFFEQNISLLDIFKKEHLKQLWGAIKGTLPSLILCAAMYELTAKLTPKTWIPGGDSPLQYLITQPYVIFHYFTTFFWPTGLSADTDWGLIPIRDIRFFVGCLFILVMLGIAFYTSRTALLRPIAFGILWFFIALAPTSSIIPLAEVLNDHRMFFPFVGLVLSVSWAIGLVVFKYLADAKSLVFKYKRLLWVPVILLLLTCAYGTYKRNEVWHSEESLWLNVTLKSPKNGRGLMNYGIIKVDQGKYAEAQSYFNRALQLLPNYSFVYVNIAVLREKMGNTADAEKFYLNGILLGPTYPSHFSLYGQFLYNQKRYREAAAALEKAVSMSSAYLEPRYHLMKTFEALQQWDNLELLARNTLQLMPNDADATQYLGDALAKKSHIDLEADRAKLSPTPEKYLQLSLDYYLDRKYDQCITAAQEALKLRANYAEAYNNIGSAYIALQQFDYAVAALRQAIRLKPGYTLAKNNLLLAENHKIDPALATKTHSPEDYVNDSMTYLGYRMYDMSIAACESALELRPGYDLAYNNLCVSYRELHNFDRAIEVGEAGLKLNPNSQLLKENLARAVAGKNSQKK